MALKWELLKKDESVPVSFTHMFACISQQLARKHQGSNTEEAALKGASRLFAGSAFDQWLWYPPRCLYEVHGLLARVRILIQTSAWETQDSSDGWLTWGLPISFTENFLAPHLHYILLMQSSLPPSFLHTGQTWVRVWWLSQPSWAPAPFSFTGVFPNKYLVPLISS